MNNLTTPYRSVVAWFTQRKLLNMQNKEVVVAFVDFTLPLLSLYLENNDRTPKPKRFNATIINSNIIGRTFNPIWWSTYSGCLIALAI